MTILPSVQQKSEDRQRVRGVFIRDVAQADGKKSTTPSVLTDVTHPLYLCLTMCLTLILHVLLESLLTLLNLLYFCINMTQNVIIFPSKY